MDLSEPWGKFDRVTGVAHHLAHHCADVAACFLALANIAVVRSRLETAAQCRLDEVAIERLGVLVFLHDIGKLHPGFQAKCWPAGIWKQERFGHLQEGYDLFTLMCDGPAATALHIEALSNWGVDERHLMSVLAHHGRPLSLALGDRSVRLRQVWRRWGAYDPDAAAARIGAVMPSWFPLAFQEVSRPLHWTPAFEHLFAGLTALADWIGSDQNRVGFVPTLDVDYMARARQTATATLMSLGVDARRQRQARRADATFAEISDGKTPNAQQELVGATARDARLIILEAETGAGKTEAALWRYIQLFESGRVDSLYFAVPTRAAATQLHRRIAAASQRLFGAADPQPVLAVPGYIRAGAAEGIALPHWQVRWDDERDADEAALAARWAAEHSKRFLAAQIAVGTIDQAMLGALMVKHAHLRSASLSRSLLVIDEVHASDRFMTAIQKRLIDAHLEIGGYAMLMSATLGATARSLWLNQTLPSFEDAVAAPYPAVWALGQPHAPSGSPPRTKTVAIATLVSMAPDAAAQVAMTEARRGARVLVIRNTVTRAVETLKAIEQLVEPADSRLLFRVNGVVTLHHSRFAPEDRRLLDGAAEEVLSTNQTRLAGGKIIIGTQTLEQSLDIDADILLTDLCPIDVLLQRIGRLHRHVLPRPSGFEAPRCVVMIPEAGLAPLLAPNFENGLGAWRTQDGTYGGIYRDLGILELTRRLVAEHATWSIPAMNRLLVESATHSEAIERLYAELGPSWRDYENNVFAGKLAMEQVARIFSLDRSKHFDDIRFPDAEERISTRLGEEGARIEFDDPPQGPFGAVVTEIVLPAHLSVAVPVDQSPIVMAASDGSITFSVGEKTFVYDRYGVRRF